ncbi:MAG: transketolase C-terminal domain-containing protein, partial [Gemmatimonadales bacterium]
WRTCGVAAEIAATVAENAFGKLRAPILRVTLPDAPAPTSGVLERAYFIGATEVLAAVQHLVFFKESSWPTKSLS